MAKKGSEGPTKSNGKALAPAATRLPATTGAKLAGRGFENLERSDILLPRLTLLQPLSPEVMEKGEKAGTLYINLSNRNIGKDAVITPILHYRSRIKWVPKDDGGGIDCRSNDAKVPLDPTKYSETCAACPEKDWHNAEKKKEDQVPNCTLYENFVVLVGGEPEPVILPMASTKAAVAKKFYSMMALKGQDMWSFQYKLGITQQKNAKDQSYFNYIISDIGKKTDDKLKKVCEQLWSTLSKANITTEMEPEPEATEAPAEASSGKF